jgi:hypothetical protein
MSGEKRAGSQSCLFWAEGLAQADSSRPKGIGEALTVGAFPERLPRKRAVVEACTPCSCCRSDRILNRREDITAMPTIFHQE